MTLKLKATLYTRRFTYRFIDLFRVDFYFVWIFYLPALQTNPFEVQVNKKSIRKKNPYVKSARKTSGAFPA